MQQYVMQELFHVCRQKCNTCKCLQSLMMLLKRAGAPDLLLRQQEQPPLPPSAALPPNGPSRDSWILPTSQEHSNQPGSGDAESRSECLKGQELKIQSLFLNYRAQRSSLSSKSKSLARFFKHKY